MSTTLEEKIKKNLYQQAGQLGFFGCWQMLDDSEIMDKHEIANAIGDTLARLIGYSSINDYINENPNVRSCYYTELKSGITHFSQSYDMFVDEVDVDIELTEEEIAEITEIVESSSAID